MRTKKLLSLILTLCMALTAIGTMGITVNAETTVTAAVNVPQNVTYTLPETVNGQTVTWSSATVDTSKIGYKLYTGTLADSSTVTYRVNVGEWKTLMADSMDALKDTDNSTSYWDGTAISVTGGKLYKRAVGYNDACTAQAVNDNGNYVMSYGPETSAPGYTLWFPSAGTLKDEFKLSYKVKVVNYDLTANASGGSHAVHKTMFGSSYNAVEFRVGESTDSTQFSNLTVHVNDTGVARAIPEDTYTYTVENNILNTGWVDINLMAFDNKFAVTTAEQEILAQQAWKTYNTSVGFSRLDIGKPTTYANAPGTVYFDDLSLSQLIYVTDTLEEKSVTTAVEQGDAAAQTATVALTMSDGSTKDFTVNFTADTKDAGTGKTANGTIDGFDGTVPVTYTVTGVTDKTINTYIGADVTLADGITKADTTAFGRKYYKVTTDSGIMNYTVNTGDWEEKRYDDMEKHSNGEVDTNADGVNDTTALVPYVADGLKLNVKYLSGDESYAEIAEETEENQVIALGPGSVNSDHLSWALLDAFEGSFKVGLRIKAAEFGATTQERNPITFAVYNSEVKPIARFTLFVNSKNADNSLNYYSLAAYKTDSSTHSGAARIYNLIYNEETQKYSTPWIDVEIIGEADTDTIDVYVNDTLYYSDLPILMNSSNVAYSDKVDFGSFVAAKRTAEEKLSAMAYIDDLKISNYTSFTGTLPDGEEVLVGKDRDTTASEIALALSSGAVRKFTITAENVDTSVLGTVDTTASITGFDDKVDVKAKVCNYNVSALNFMKGTEYTSSPVGGGTVATAGITNKGGRENATAVFAWYNASGKIESVKYVSLAGIGQDETKTVNVGLALPSDVEGGYLRVFVLDALNTLVPVDIADEFTGFTQSKPTVFVAGASIMQNYEDNRFPEQGIGQNMGRFFDGLEVVNLANSGKSTTTYITYGFWEKIMSQVKTGDYIFVAFGHNDQSTVTGEQYKKNLEKFVTDAQSKGANIILCTPIARRHEGLAGTAYEAHNGTTLKDETMWYKMDNLKAVCEKYGIPCIDMATLTTEYLQGLKDNPDTDIDEQDVESKKLYMCDIYYSWDSVYKNLRDWSEDDDFANEAYRSGQYGMQDNTHCTMYGAAVWAQLMTKTLKENYPNILLSQYIINSDKTISYPWGTME